MVLQVNTLPVHRCALQYVSKLSIPEYYTKVWSSYSENERSETLKLCCQLVLSTAVLVQAWLQMSCIKPRAMQMLRWLIPLTSLRQG